MSTVTLPLKLRELVDLKNYSSMEEFIAAITNNFVVEVPASVTNVLVSNEEPDSSQSDYFWVALDNAGNFSGLRLFAQGAWRQIYPVAGQIIRVVGDSDEPPPGYKVIDSADVGGSEPLAAMQLQWYPAESEGPWQIFDVVYVGF